MCYHRLLMFKGHKLTTVTFNMSLNEIVKQTFNMI